MRFAVCGTIGAGKSVLLKEYSKLNKSNFKVFYESPESWVLKRYYKYLAILNLMKNVERKKIWCFLTFIILVSYFRNFYTYVIIFQILVMLWLIKRFCKGVCFDTQIYFLGLRKKSEEEKKKDESILIGEDRCFLEDKLFPQTQMKYGFLSKTQFDIYNTFYNEYVKDLTIPNLWIFLDVTPERAYKNLQERIKKNSTTNERMITLDYLKTLGAEYNDWKEDMESKYGDKFIVIDNNKEFFTAKQLDQIIKIKFFGFK